MYIAERPNVAVEGLHKKYTKGHSKVFNHFSSYYFCRQVDFFFPFLFSFGFFLLFLVIRFFYIYHIVLDHLSLRS